MKKAFIRALDELSERDENIFLLTGDLGFSVFEEYREKFPGRFINAGVAEQNMTGVAAGLALKGKKVFIYSIVPFAVMRSFEQIRNDICMHKLEVKIVGYGAGLCYGSAGSSHYALSDINLMRSLPGMVILSPATSDETVAVVKAAVKHEGPVYIRLARATADNIEVSNGSFCFTKGVLLKEGTDVTIVSTGSIVERTLKVAENLEGKNISVRVVHIHTIKPLDKKIIIESAKKTRALFSLEEHSVIGGLGSSVAEVLAENKCNVVFKRFGLPDSFVKQVGQRDYLLDVNSLSVDRLTAAILEVIEGVKGERR